MSRQELEQKIAALKGLGGISEEQQREIICTLIGHSRIITICFGYVSCARCEHQIGDTLAGMFDTSDCVIVGHNCEACRANYEKLDWTDKYLTPDPFVDPTKAVVEGAKS